MRTPWKNLRRKTYRARLALRTTAWMRSMQITMLRGEMAYMRTTEYRAAQAMAFVARGMGL